MSSSYTLLEKSKPAESAISADQEPSKAICWYRSPMDPKTMKILHQRSDFRGFFQTAGYLAILASTFTLSVYAWYHWTPILVVFSIFLHGTVTAFMINGVHELGHGTVFKTKAFNAFFNRVLSFLGWINFEIFEVSHSKHHRYTLHQPDDLEVTLPAKVLVRDFFLYGFINLPKCKWMILNVYKVACGKFKEPWESSLFPDSEPELQKKAINWARFLLIGHGLIFLTACITGWWWLIILINFGPCYGELLQNLCNHTQHIGLQDDISDFRSCCRTFTTNPVIQFLYWHMNYHIEHHMYAAVPCYNLQKLHNTILQDLPPCPHGLVETWKQIFDILEKQRKDPTYQYIQPLPLHPNS